MPAAVGGNLTGDRDALARTLIADSAVAPRSAVFPARATLWALKVLPRTVLCQAVLLKNGHLSVELAQENEHTFHVAENALVQAFLEVLELEACIRNPARDEAFSAA